MLHRVCKVNHYAYGETVTVTKEFIMAYAGANRSPRLQALSHSIKLTQLS
jgi:hypothetical protein